MRDSTVAERLGRYIGDGPEARMSIRSFAKAMKKREPRPRGSTRAMIHRYLEAGADGPLPPSDFIEAAADELGLNPEWLAFGKGEPDEGREAVAGVSAEREAPGDVNRRLRALKLKWDVLKGLGFRPPELPDEPGLLAWAKKANLAALPHWLPLLAEVERRTGRGGEDIGQALRGPLIALDPDLDMSDEMDPTFRLAPWLDDYITAMAPVLLSLEGVLADEPGARKWDRRTSGTVKHTTTAGGDDDVG